jgi:large subunit ribosomal protein L1
MAKKEAEGGATATETKEKKKGKKAAAEGDGAAAAAPAAATAEASTAGTGGEAKKGKKKEAQADAAAPAPAPAAEAAAGDGAAAPAADGAKAAAGGEDGEKKKYRRVSHVPSKRFLDAVKALEGKITKAGIPLRAAVKTLKGFKGLKFDQTVECIVHLGIDPKQADQLVRGSLSLPHGVGKTNKVIVFCPEDQAGKAKEAGAIEAGLDALVKKVSDGWMDFDVAVATPDVMAKIARLGRVLGPQGKMPNPKSGTVAADIATAVREHSAGKIQFRNDDGGNVHAKVGKFSFSEEKLFENISSFLDFIRKAKPNTAKGVYLKKITIKGTMTPGVGVDVNSVVTAEEKS